MEKITSLFGAGRAVSIKADVSKEEDVKKMIHLAVSEFGKSMQHASCAFVVVVVVCVEGQGSVMCEHCMHTSEHKVTNSQKRVIRDCGSN